MGGIFLAVFQKAQISTLSDLLLISSFCHIKSYPNLGFQITLWN